MKITITRTGPRSYASTAQRADKVVVSVPGHDRPSVIPHDIVHLIVERALKFEFGFWGKVAKGAMFDGMDVLDGRRKPHAKTKSRTALKQGNQMGTQAEVMVDVFAKLAFASEPVSYNEAVRTLSERWAPAGAKPIAWNEELVSGICNELTDAARLWQALPEGESISFEW